MHAQSAGRIPPDDIVHVEHATDAHLAAGFLRHLALSGRAGCLTGLDMATRKTPQPREGPLGALDEQHFAVAENRGAGAAARPLGTALGAVCHACVDTGRFNPRFSRNVAPL